MLKKYTNQYSNYKDNSMKTIVIRSFRNIFFFFIDNNKASANHAFSCIIGAFPVIFGILLFTFQPHGDYYLSTFQVAVVSKLIFLRSIPK